MKQRTQHKQRGGVFRWRYGKRLRDRTRHHRAGCVSAWSSTTAGTKWSGPSTTSSARSSTFRVLRGLPGRAGGFPYARERPTSCGSSRPSGLCTGSSGKASRAHEGGLRAPPAWSAFVLYVIALGRTVPRPATSRPAGRCRPPSQRSRCSPSPPGAGHRGRGDG